MSYGTFSLENRDCLGFRMIFKVWLNQIFQTLTQCCGPLNTGEVRFQSYFTFNVPQLWPFFFFENKDFLGFRTIFKVWLNQIFSNVSTMLWASKYGLSSIMVYFTFTVPEL
jgi:hypothetical protein